MFENYGDVLTVKQLCQILQISRNTAYNLIVSGVLAYRRIGGHYRILKSSVIQYLSNPLTVVSTF